jgi:hypothetical protein
MEELRKSEEGRILQWSCRFRLEKHQAFTKISFPKSFCLFFCSKRNKSFQRTIVVAVAVSVVAVTLPFIVVVAYIISGLW